MQNTTFKTIDKKRKEVGLTQKQMAAYLGVSQTVYSNWKRGVSTVPEDMIKKAYSCNLALVKCPCCGNIKL